MSSVPSTQLELAVSNLTATINRINDSLAFGSVTPAWLMGQVNEFAAALDSYVVAGGDPTGLLGSLCFGRTLSDATVRVLRSGYHRQPFVDEDYIIQTMKETVMDVTAITETLGHSAFGDNLECRWHGFIVNRACQAIFGEF
tara:strand:- start:148 stop:573 length:426 start_codon:yes stop_codon:yes gene_type:complete